MARRYVRAPDLLLCWRDGRLFVDDLSGAGTARAGPDLVVILDLFSRPRTIDSAVRALPSYEPRSLRRSIRELRSIRYLLPEAAARKRKDRLRAWKWNLASAYYHVATRDLQYVSQPEAMDVYLRANVATHPRPARFKRHPRAARVALDRDSFPAPGAGLDETLLSRRTVRLFSREPVPQRDFAAVLRGTFGRTGDLDAGYLGRLALKTSPSAGGLHPIECYVLVNNVVDVARGIYHYDVASDELRRLRHGDPRAAGVRAASGQQWVGGSAFVCILTAVFRRTLWKYAFESAYRTLWLDAGHLGQTFCLLATSRGLGPFVTAAIQDTFIEELLGLEGSVEFPVYLCGAGLPRGAGSETERSTS